MGNIKKVLVANRGEIALRVMKTCTKMNIKTVAIFSDADQKAPFVKYADEKIHIGPSPSNKSYLNQDLIIKSAIDYDVDAIHPGYGFLSENFEFAQKVIDAGLIFIGPSPVAIQVMGDKLSAKKTVSKFKIPLVPGLDEEITDLDLAMNTAENIGFPILIKASAGGGGKGMRIVHHKKEFKQQMERAVSEAEKSFGNGAVFIEKYLEKPRHIEIQILADQYGNVVYLFERDCSVQRRHQKLTEETPSPFMTDKLRDEMGEAAVKAAEYIKYEGAGTVEFLVDKHRNFYFMEMNTRIQVEHPITEEVINYDLIREQILVAAGVPITGKNYLPKLHSIECRINAEDPYHNFRPSPGKITTFHAPGGHGIRLDTHVYSGYIIPPNYDSMIAKLIVTAQTREEAINKMKRALDEFIIEGVKTTIPFHRQLMDHPDYIDGNYTTKFMESFEMVAK